MAPRTKKLTPEQEQLATAQAMRDAFHQERGTTDPKSWEELSEEKQARWMDKAVGNED